MKTFWERIYHHNAIDLVKTGTQLLESEFGMDLKSIATSPAFYVGDKVSWTAIGNDGKSINYLMTRGFEHYGPHVYALIEIDEQGKTVEDKKEIHRPILVPADRIPAGLIEVRRSVTVY